MPAPKRPEPLTDLTKKAVRVLKDMDGDDIPPSTREAFEPAALVIRDLLGWLDVMQRSALCPTTGLPNSICSCWRHGPEPSGPR